MSTSPVRGFAKQALPAALMVFSANIRAIETFVQSYREALSKPPSDPGPKIPARRPRQRHQTTQLTSRHPSGQPASAAPRTPQQRSPPV
ncbi:hypothetical protein [Demequina sediminicola]|uniref:hypothetical protein n=1 Tax=Demequina sediminicola TaxID=1095026 RepID=UPI000AFF186C|nr:hypothetical protein [Demequina sediminicola]